MGYTAVHPVWGRLDASRDDLGCGRAWGDVHRVKGLRLACPECGGRVFARASRYVIRHFYHQVRPQDCELANESPEHHLLKLELAMAARAAGWRAELEVSGEARNWRADVMVFDEQDRPFMALEAQLSPMTQDEAQMRTDRYARDGVAVCWVALQERPWERFVPSLRVHFPRQRDETWKVWHGMARYAWEPRTLKAKAKWVHITCPLDDAIKWILEGRVRVHTAANGTVRWTAPAYKDLALVRARMEAEVEAAERAAAAERRRKEAEERIAAGVQRRRDAERRAQERARAREAELQRLAAFFELAGLDSAVWETFTQMVRSASGKAIRWGDLSPAHGDGLLVYARPRGGGGGFHLSGVVCPDPGALVKWPAGLTILVPSRGWLSRIQAAARSPLKVAVLDPVTGHRDFIRVAPPSAITPVRPNGPDRA